MSQRDRCEQVVKGQHTKYEPTFCFLYSGSEAAVQELAREIQSSELQDSEEAEGKLPETHVAKDSDS